MFCIAAGHAISANATSQKTVRLSCSGNRVLKTANVLSANVLDINYIVNFLSDIAFDHLSIRKFWEKLFFKEGQFAFIDFALNQLIVGVLYGVCG